MSVPWNAQCSLWKRRSCVLWCLDRPWNRVPLKRLLSTSAHHNLHHPTILFESNHLLVVNKPVGWHSVPNQGQPSNDPKCLLRYLIQQKLGGGSQRNFLRPLHRIDQPCSGVLLLGKTSRAASRIQTAWKQVRKTYLVVVHMQYGRHDLNHLMQSSNEWKTLSGYMLRRQSQYASTSWVQEAAKKGGGWSVTMILASPNDNNGERNMEQYRYCTLDWRCLSLFSWQQQQHYALLEIQTSQGARHMVRALLASHGFAVVGDVRYGTTSNLPDRSVALHAAVLELPATIPLGDARQQRRFLAPIPDEWSSYFGISQSNVMEHLETKQQPQHRHRHHQQQSKKQRHLRKEV